ncbi:helix-turn-helix domain-containing protein [Anaerotignum sp. MB30-C6]|uniref:helix-turn-helix domain-containing protein n=1 Tax=Anaerotignum sp. MB30-C6 TaxID=3070814 RepID=UPI0027DD62DB|nr:helix-turn-helix transcriptional regulator [Anaerotignum sp. MB30-C6]WMI82067.1 helix-turn-helix transcriptional regulator [Anaerotignum sp. MB30-C6]
MNVVDYNATIPKNVFRIIKEAGMKQCAVAEKAGYTKQQFNDMLNGRRVIKAKDILALSHALGVSPNDLFMEHEKQKEKDAS